MEREADLRRAVACGLLLWPVRGLGAVELEKRLLRFDPDMDAIERGKRVLAILRELDARQRTGIPGTSK